MRKVIYLFSILILFAFGSKAQNIVIVYYQSQPLQGGQLQTSVEQPIYNTPFANNATQASNQELITPSNNSQRISNTLTVISQVVNTLGEIVHLYQEVRNNGNSPKQQNYQSNQGYNSPQQQTITTSY